ncbi:MAG: hypothetical protein Q9175_005589, partial [Cornicularia normoerica]
IINAFLHPQTAAYAFQLSINQLKYFADLGTAGDAAKIAGAETVLPLAKEPDARIGFTFVGAVETPLRIYKNEYDKPPLSYLQAHSSCMKRQDERLAVSFDEAMKIVKENGWDKEPRTYAALLQDRPSLRDVYLRTESPMNPDEA